ncbi:MAG: hypothetical protein O7D91_14515, partial [Planctomycetota bacterium]|nr:hypothetical protein [Planctomycetota bacterium]
RSSVLVIAVAVCMFVSARALAQPGTVLSHQKISDTEGGFTGILDDGDGFGCSVASLGDLDGDGVGDLAVGAVGDGDGGVNHGAVWVLSLSPDGTVKSHQKISDTEGGFTGILDDFDFFGMSAAALGDLDGDGVGDLAVGTAYDDDGGGGVTANRGAVWVLFRNLDGTVKTHQKISDTAGGTNGILDDNDRFGWSVSPLGDLDGDGVGDLAVGAPGDADGGLHRGAVWVLFLNGVSACPTDGDGRVTICHIPRGNPDKAHTITVHENAVPAHLAHGDLCGPCEEDDGLLLGDNSDGHQDGCSTDLDDSGDVGAADLAELLGAWGPNSGHPADLDGDGDVAAFDLAILLGNWGPCP